MVRIIAIYCCLLGLSLMLPAAAQTPNDAEIASAWEVCKPHEIQGRLAVQQAWQDGWGGRSGEVNCPAVKAAYASSPAALAAKENVKRDEADKGRIEELTKRLSK